MENKINNEINSTIASSTVLVSFEGWIKFIEGFCRGLQTTKTVDSVTVFDCVGEIMEYMKSLKNQLVALLTHCENVLNQQEETENKIKNLEENTKKLMEENQSLLRTIDNLTEQNVKLKQALEINIKGLKGEKNGNTKNM